MNLDFKRKFMLTRKQNWKRKAKKEVLCPETKLQMKYFFPLHNFSSFYYIKNSFNNFLRKTPCHLEKRKSHKKQPWKNPKRQHWRQSKTKMLLKLQSLLLNKNFNKYFFSFSFFFFFSFILLLSTHSFFLPNHHNI